jgi:hypothetical protein
MLGSKPMSITRSYVIYEKQSTFPKHYTVLFIYGLFNDAVCSSGCIASWEDDKWIVNWEVCGQPSWHNLRRSSDIWGGTCNTTKDLRIVGLLAKTWTRNFWVRSRSAYHSAETFDVLFCFRAVLLLTHTQPQGESSVMMLSVSQIFRKLPVFCVALKSYYRVLKIPRMGRILLKGNNLLFSDRVSQCIPWHSCFTIRCFPFPVSREEMASASFCLILPVNKYLELPLITTTAYLLNHSSSLLILSFFRH